MVGPPKLLNSDLLKNNFYLLFPSSPRKDSVVIKLSAVKKKMRFFYFLGLHAYKINSSHKLFSSLDIEKIAKIVVLELLNSTTPPTMA